MDETGLSTVHTVTKIIAIKGAKQVGSMTSGERGCNVTIGSETNRSTGGSCSVAHITPEAIRPFPKAGPRKTSRGGRKPGRCRILTDTPEKYELEMQREVRAKKTSKKTSQGVKRVKRVLVDESSSDESEPNSPMFEDSSDSTIDEPEEGNLEHETLVGGDFVLVKMLCQKSIGYFVAEISSILEEDQLEIRFLKRILGSTRKFT